MPLRRWLRDARPMPGAPGLSARRRRRRRSGATWRRTCAAAGGRLLALWGSATRGPYTVRMIVLVPNGAVARARARADGGSSAFPGIEDVFPAASRMQRAMRDLLGLETTDPRRAAVAAPCRVAPRHVAARDARPALPRLAGRRRLPRSCASKATACTRSRSGPVHAGIIEPGHFRFSVVGEKVLRLEERLGYVHKGIERRFTELPIARRRIASRRASPATPPSRIAWAYCQALEGMTARAIPAARAWLRALLLELERIANHLGDLGALGNDAGFAFGLAQFLRLKEGLLRATERALGAALPDGCVVPGGVRTDLTRRGRRGARGVRRSRCSTRSRRLRDIYDEHPGVRDRFAGRRHGDARARGASRPDRSRGSRQRPGASICAATCPASPTRRSGVRSAAPTTATCSRAWRCGSTSCWNRCASCARSSRSCRAVTPLATSVPEATDGAIGIGLVEGWRGPVRDRARSGARRHDPPLPSARPVVAELAGARARDHRQHRSGFSVDQQVVQPLLQRPRPLTQPMLEDAETDRAGRHRHRSAAGAGRRVARPREPASDASARSSAARCASARSTPARATAASSRSTRSAIRSTTSRALGIRFVASPRHADLLLVTGPVSRHMEVALRRTYDATPDPKLVVAVGDCGCVRRRCSARATRASARVSNVIPVDVVVPGCPPTPTRLMQGILTAISSPRVGGDGTARAVSDRPGR